MLSKLIRSMDRGSEFAVNILDTLHFVNAAWDGVSQHSVTRCFQKCGIDEDGVQCENVDITPLETEIGEQLHHLQHSGLTGLEGITPEEFIEVDCEVVVAEELTTESIVAQVQDKTSNEWDEEEDDGEANDIQEAPVSLPKALASTSFSTLCFKLSKNM